MEKNENVDVSCDTQDDLQDIFSILNSVSNSPQESKEINLLNSLKPYLNEKRQKKLAQCEKIMSLTETLKLLNDLHLFDSFLNNTDE